VAGGVRRAAQSRRRGGTGSVSSACKAESRPNQLSWSTVQSPPTLLKVAGLPRGRSALSLAHSFTQCHYIHLQLRRSAAGIAVEERDGEPPASVAFLCVR
jgi:hypothetical protein